VNWNAIALELGTLGLAVLILAWDLTFGSKSGSSRSVHHGLGLIGLAGLFVWSFTLPTDVYFTTAFVQDSFALFIKQIMLVAGFLAILAAQPYAKRRGWSRRSGEFLILLLFAIVGGMALVSAQEFLTLFVAFELLSLPLYTLAAIEKKGATAPEGALKMFLFGSVSAAVLLLGVGLLFSASGSTFWNDMPADLPNASLLGLGSLLLIAGFGFKIAIFPFYLWVPDTYESAPTPVVAFLSVAPKAAGIAALLRLYFEFFGVHTPEINAWMGVLAALTMIVGTLLALPQTNLKRLLAYSGVAQIGYVMLSLAAGTPLAAGMALFFFVAYLFSNMGAFLSLAALEAVGEEPTLHGVRNLIRRAPLLAISFLVFLLSLGGIPFVLGFWGKMNIFLAAASAGLWWLVFLGAVLAVVALYYYLNVARFMFIVDEEGPVLSPPLAITIAILICVLVVAGGGLVPGLLVDRAQEALAGF